MSRNLNILTILFLTLILSSGPASEVTPPNLFNQSQIDYVENTVRICGAEVEITNTPDAQDGYNLFVLLRTDTINFEREHIMLIVDMNGEVFLEEPLPENYWISDCPAEFIDPTSILVQYLNTTAISPGVP